MILVTDTGSDILESEAAENGITLVSITASFSDKVFDTNTLENFENFYNELESREDLPISSQPSPAAYVSIYEEAKEKNEEVLVITISSRISGTYNCAELAKSIAEYDKVHVVDSLAASVSLRLLVFYAVKLINEGKTCAEIETALNIAKRKVVLYGLPETLLYLKKGGRICPVLADIGEKLKIKPVLTLENGVIECKKKVRGKSTAIKEMQLYSSEAQIDPTMPIFFGYSKNASDGADFMNSTMGLLSHTQSVLAPVGPAIGTHIGPNALLISFLTK